MIIKNSKGHEKEFKLLMEVEKNDIKYIVYQDINNSNNIYAGKYEDKSIKKISSNEYQFLDKLLNEIKD